MRRFRLNGWQRIGIALSVLWAVFALFYFHHAAVKEAGDSYGIFYVGCIERLGGRDTSQESYSNCSDLAMDLYRTTFADRWPSRGLAALALIPIAWLLAYVVLWLVRWVRRGF